ncbi:hypothetical protein [Pseudonocardia abyssalis]|uniref:hypothetical protein n=1 Tax=Pseudonocardia abyssalis TaxID=2792008 RepID=UPI001CEC9580|nr:hypothetical protein [Pseudonocardia abyssalis]
MDAGRLVLTEDLAALRTPTGLVTLRTPDPARAAGVLGRAVVGRSGAVLTVRTDDPAAVNAHLVSSGIAVAELAAQRRSLEQVVLELTGPGTDRVGAL